MPDSDFVPAVQLFESEQFGSVRIIREGDNFLFCGKDVASALGYAVPQKALERHCPYGTKRTVGVVTGKKADGSDAVQQVEMVFIPEGVDDVSLFQ